MKIIERKFLRLRKDVVAEYRRIKTPFFYINLKPKEYARYDYRSRFLSMGYFGSFLLPNNETMRCQGWRDYKKNEVFDKKIIAILDIANESVKDNVINLSA